MSTTQQTKWLDAPKSTNTVRVRLIDTTSVMLLHAKTFVQPVTKSHETMNMTDVSFLVENERQQRKALFDLGIRKDWWNQSPRVSEILDYIALGVRVDKDVPQILRENGISLTTINDIMWSHSHWDHTGDPSLFPTSTTLVYGPGISEDLPGYPSNPNTVLPESYFTGRTHHEISFESSQPLKIGGFSAYDFYGDASFYLLETPGHAKGHMCGLARVDADSDGTGHFVLLGGDVCHFCGDMRPNELCHLPHELDSLVKEHPRFKNPPATLQIPSGQREERRSTPWYCLATGDASAYDFPSAEVAQETVDSLTAHFDVAANVLVALAHDSSILEVLPTLNHNPDQDLSGWFEKGWKEQVYWLWTNELSPEKKPIVEGFWKEGKRFDTAADLIKSLE